MTPVRQPYRVLIEVKVWAYDEDDAYQRAAVVCSSRSKGVQKPLVQSVEPWEES